MGINEQLVEESNKPVIKTFERRMFYARFKDNTWAADFAKMGSLSSKNKNVKCLLSAIDVFPKYAWVKALKDKNGKTVLNAFIKIVNESNRKPNKLWVDQRRDLFNKTMQDWLDNDNISVESAHNEGNSVIAGRFTRILRTKNL